MILVRSGDPGELLERPRERGSADPPAATAPAPATDFLLVLDREGVRALVLHHALLGDGELGGMVVRVPAAAGLAVAAAALRRSVQADRVG